VTGGGPRVRILTYNVHGLRGDIGALVAMVRSAAPDVVVVQEAPRRLRWRTRCAHLADRLGMYVAGGGQPALGNLILTGLRVEVTGARCVRYPLTPGRHLRGAVLVDAAVAGTRFVVAGSHLATDPVERPSQAALLAREIAAARWPCLLGADVNDVAGSKAWQTLTGTGLVDAGAEAGETYPAVVPHRRIDAVLVDPGCTVVDARVLDTPEARRASDHLPVLAELELPG
jgi:endonuclease/exonuclease/phosphatase family metal-dependent hydrolase